MTVFVHDASILLDLIHTDLLHLFTAIPAGMVTTDFVVAEIADIADASELAAATESGALKVLRSSMTELESIAAVQALHLGLSTADCSVLFHAGRLGAVVLTGDRRLRRAASDTGLEVHGTMWAFDELVSRRQLSPRLAAGKLEQLLELNPRLPRDECGRKIEHWRK
jgi:predicted nucleic acid-binding protein